MGHVNWLTVGNAYDPSRNEIVHAQFNVAYGFARALADGKVDLRTYTRPKTCQSPHRCATSITTIVDDPKLNPTAIEPVRIELRLKDGHVIDRRTDIVKGSPQAPMTDAERLSNVSTVWSWLRGPRAAKPIVSPNR